MVNVWQHPKHLCRLWPCLKIGVEQIKFLRKRAKSDLLPVFVGNVDLQPLSSPGESPREVCEITLLSHGQRGVQIRRATLGSPGESDQATSHRNGPFLYHTKGLVS